MNWDALWNRPLLFDLAVLFTVTTISYLILAAALRIASNRLHSLSQRRRAKSYFFAAQLLRNTSRLLMLGFRLASTSPLKSAISWYSATRQVASRH